jgi:simple sugar transport system permease protein
MRRVRGLVLSPSAVTVMAIAAGAVLLAVGLELTGYHSGQAFRAMWHGAFGSWYAFTSATLLRAIPLIVIALGFALALKGGALNIGAEGQFYAGAIAATWIGLQVHSWGTVPAILAVWLASCLAGVVWMALPVLLRTRYGVLEAISTLLMNFIALSLVSYMVQGPLQEASGIYPQSDQIAEVARIPLIAGTRLHWGIAVAFGLAALIWWIFKSSQWGFHLRAVGQGAEAALVTGRIDRNRVLAAALLWSGALAGLAGGFEVSGVSHALYQNLSPGYGFAAIAVALLARLDPRGIVLSGILFGALEAGAGAMQRDAGVPSVAVYVVEAVVILVILLAGAAKAAGLGSRSPALSVGVEP